MKHTPEKFWINVQRKETKKFAETVKKLRDVKKKMMNSFGTGKIRNKHCKKINQFKKLGRDVGNEKKEYTFKNIVRVKRK